MKKIPSFQIDHTILEKGIYISRIDDDITTYDIRMRAPNREPVMTNASMHTIEHLFATYVRNTEFGDNIIYFGPMGCRTGFYFLTRSLSDSYCIQLIKDAFAFIADFWGSIPGRCHERVRQLAGPQPAASQGGRQAVFRDHSGLDQG